MFNLHFISTHLMATMRQRLIIDTLTKLNFNSPKLLIDKLATLGILFPSILLPLVSFRTVHRMLIGWFRDLILGCVENLSLDPRLWTHYILITKRLRCAFDSKRQWLHNLILMWSSSFCNRPIFFSPSCFNYIIFIHFAVKDLIEASNNSSFYSV